MSGPSRRVFAGGADSLSRLAASALIAAVVLGVWAGCGGPAPGGDVADPGCPEITAECLPEGDDGADLFCGPDPGAGMQSSDDCNVVALWKKDGSNWYHRGNHRRHDWCADAAPRYNKFYDPAKGGFGDRYAGADAVLGGKSFDCYHEDYNDAGLLVDRYICEVKVGSWGSYRCAWARDGYLRRTLSDANVEAGIARRCGLRYVLFIADNDLYHELLARRLPGWMPRPTDTVRDRLSPDVDLRWVQQCRS